MRPQPLCHAADPERAMPGPVHARREDAQAALAALRAEERRLERIGLAEALVRCRREMRYWQFLATLFSLEGAPVARRPRREPAWRPAGR